MIPQVIAKRQCAEQRSDKQFLLVRLKYVNIAISLELSENKGQIDHLQSNVYKFRKFCEHRTGTFCGSFSPRGCSDVNDKNTRIKNCYVVRTALT